MAGRRSPAALRTVRELLRHAIRRLTVAGVAFGHGTLNARDEAAYLVLHALQLPPDRLDPYLDLPVPSAGRDAVIELVERRVRDRVPAAYLTREAWLGDFRFYVDERVIVPRSFIAELLREELAPWVADPRRVRRALDLCTGSGCLAILLAHAFPAARIDAADDSARALAVARRNVRDYGLARQITLVRSDLFAGLGARRYDLIVTNPPYVTAAAMKALPSEYRAEPRRALAGGSDGLDFVRRIVAAAPAHLKPGGLLLVETGHNRPAVEAAFPALPLTWVETSAGDDCVFVVTREELAAGRTRPARAPARPRSRRATRAARSPRRR
jgi:ribosomal protein L3 glutamine methyltransferase